MDKGLAVVVAAVVGGLVAMQAPLNAILGRAVGSRLSRPALRPR
jgi:uncharacterized membrane protein YdcZ (DUF606 family)